MEEKTINISKFHLPRWKELPSIDLYLDQVVTFVNSTLSPYILTASSKEPLLTKTMINNYVKNNLIYAPFKKQYTKKHLAKLFVICVLKQVYSMQEINNIVRVVLKDTKMSEAYDTFCELFEDALRCTYTKTEFIKIDSDDNKTYLIKCVLLSCSYKIYVRNLTI
jgi:23S rRNA C2498 (ribose-2'-O)-methylase RlmM